VDRRRQLEPHAADWNGVGAQCQLTSR
jgi:hypothetical protein